MPEMMIKENILCVHDNHLEKARNGQGIWKNSSYIWSSMEAAVVFEDFFEKPNDFRFIFIGHTHTSSVFSANHEIQFAFNQPIQLRARQPYIINPGHIGRAQRDHNKSHTYLVSDSKKDQLTFLGLEKEGREFIRQSMIRGEETLGVAAQQNHFAPYMYSVNKQSVSDKPEIKTGESTPLIFHVTVLVSF